MPFRHNAKQRWTYTLTLHMFKVLPSSTAYYRLVPWHAPKPKTREEAYGVHGEGVPLLKNKKSTLANESYPPLAQTVSSEDSRTFSARFGHNKYKLQSRTSTHRNSHMTERCQTSFQPEATVIASVLQEQLCKVIWMHPWLGVHIATGAFFSLKAALFNFRSPDLVSTLPQAPILFITNITF